MTGSGNGTDDTQVKVASEDMLRNAHRRAVRKGYNRRMTTEAINNLDPEGYNLLWILMLHEHAQGAVSEPHYRCHALLKMRDTEAPVHMVLDIPMADYDRWPTVADVKDGADE